MSLEVDIEKTLGTFHLKVAFKVDGEIFVMFGESGAGKTLTLQCVSGIQTPDRGLIRLNGKTIFRANDTIRKQSLSIHKRRIGYVFQDYALFPHLTAEENIGYGAEKIPGLDGRIKTMLERMHLIGLEKRYPDQLSGGQQQRVAIARALIPEPQTLLMDEPLASLDGTVRERLREDIRQLQAELGLNILYVTHSLDDAFSVGHRFAIFHEGHLEQVGPTEEVFRRPWTPVVARLMGTQNVFEAHVLKVTPEALVIDWNGIQLNALPQLAEVGARVSFFIRPEDVKLIYTDRPLIRALQDNVIKGRIIRKTPKGHMNLLSLRVAGTDSEVDLKLEIRFPHHNYRTMSLNAGSPISSAVPKEAIHILPGRNTKSSQTIE